ncbi:unnamed protein product [Lepeophtheirus salmonis]|uniref:(salmon louse) hypothetical protein n=1 Tax=Lepeophtheirus salmonis TaxID=72036 RepID=A0A7R8CYE9_LEPSM|nr:unnamed protein product [Lepeophtheirus salmonis]CAF2968736.1 unnamed protein product [Lepeophtheirus salmonis]
MARSIVVWIMCLSCFGSVSVGILEEFFAKKYLFTVELRLFSDLVFGNKVIDKKPKAQNDKYEFRQNYLFQKLHLRVPDSGRTRTIHKPIKSYETFPTIYAVDPEESLNIDKPGSPYVLIHKIFSNNENEVAVTKLEEIPPDLDPDEVWLSDGNLLVLKGGYSKRLKFEKRTQILNAPRKRRRVAYKRRKKLF